MLYEVITPVEILEVVIDGRVGVRRLLADLLRREAIDALRPDDALRGVQEKAPRPFLLRLLPVHRTSVQFMNAIK